MLDDRKLAVLRAIVEDYVSTNEPVGSKSLVDRHNLDVSPATVWRWDALGRMPAAIRLSNGMVRWRRREILAWIGTRLRRTWKG